MFIKGKTSLIKNQINKILDSSPDLIKGDLSHHTQYVLNNRENFFDIAAKAGSPSYIIDKKILDKAFINFQITFRHFLPSIRCYYAMKANPHPFIIQTAIKHNYGIDVSSGMELERALQYEPTSILFTGPGKTLSELELAIKHADKVTINIDSFSELNKIQAIAQREKVKIRCGIRVYSQVQGRWSKFGIPLHSLHEFWQEAYKNPNIQLQGIQFHMSFNETTESFIAIFKELKKHLLTYFTDEQRKQINFIDFGGGYISHQAKAFYPSGSLRGKIIESANKYFFKETDYIEKYYLDRSLPLEQYAKEIITGIKNYLAPYLSCDYYCEPGRIIADQSMHILLRVVDVKEDTQVIVDAGTNAVGWKIYEDTYVPIVNLTHPSKDEIPYTIYGSLCTPSDIWGRYCYAEKIEEGDFLLIPFHGGYTYSFAQNFIKPIPNVFIF